MAIKRACGAIAHTRAGARRSAQPTPQTQDFTHHRGNHALALSDEEVAKRRAKSRVRAHAEHPFRILKCVFGFRKVYCRGIAKNLNRLQVSFALVNLYTKQRQLLRSAAARRQSSARIRKGWLISPPIVTKSRSLENTKTAKNQYNSSNFTSFRGSLEHYAQVPTFC